ncbi:MAG: outer membrane beta-barrel protein [Hyphomicrobiaceae bacterium]
MRAIGTASSAAARPLPCRPLAVTAVLTLACPLPAFALDLDSVDGLIVETIASRDRLKIYDTSKQNGAERVLDRDRDFATPEGLRMRSYYVHPGIGALIYFDDNIFRSDLNKVADIKTELTPSVRLRSALPRHILDLSLEGKIVSYLENPDQNYAGAKARLDAALHFDHAHTISASLLTALEHEERGELAIKFLSAAEPIPVFHNKASVGITRDVGRLYGTLMGTVETWDYIDADAIGGGTVDQDPRDTQEYSTALRFGYRISPGFDFVGKVRAVKSENRGDLTFDRDATGYELMAGVAFQSSPLLRWRVMGGYGTRNFEEPGIEDISTALFEANMQWLPTQFVTVSGTAAREIIAADAVEPAGRVETRLRGQIDYEIWHSAILKLGLEYRDSDYIGTTRNDTQYSASAELEYFMNKNWLFTIGYEYSIRESTEPAFDMTRNRFMLGAKLRW